MFAYWRPITTYWHIAESGEWICEEVGDDYTFSFDDMVVIWRRYGVNVMRYW